VTLLSAAPAEETAFLWQALAQVDGPRVRVDRRPRLGPPPADSAGPPPVVLVWDLLPPADQVAAWRARGAGFVLLAGPRVAARRGAGAPWPALLQGMADRTAERGGRLAGWRAEHPLFAPFREVPQALGEARAWQYPRLDAARGAEVLARFDDGLPAIVRDAGAGPPQYVVAIPLGAAEGEWPLHPAYVPLVQQLVHEASGGAGTVDALVTGARWRLPEGVRDPVVRAPGGALLRPGASGTDAAVAAVPLADAGVYQLFAGRAAGVPLGQQAVNVPEGESRLEALPAALVRPGTGAGEGAAPEAAVAAPPERSPQAWERQQNGWRWLLLLAALLVLVEVVVATRGRRAVVEDALVRRTAPPTR
jgi:hypothetical protein